MVFSLRTSSIAMFAALVASPVAAGAGFSCVGLVPEGQKMICTSFEPNWAIELSCADSALTSNFIDAFSSNGLVQTPGTVAVSSADPWAFLTSHPIGGTIAETPSSCTEAGSGLVRDFTFTPTQVPGLASLRPICCRLE